MQKNTMVELRGYRSRQDFDTGRAVEVDTRLHKFTHAQEIARTLVLKGEFTIVALADMGAVKPIQVIGLEN